MRKRGHRNASFLLWTRRPTIHTWQRFKKRLLDAVQKRDKQFLLSILDKNVRNQDERSRGIANFRKQWELDTDDSPLWRELAAALELGGAYMKRDQAREFCAPYLLARWPDDLPPFRHGVVISRDTQVQAEPPRMALPSVCCLTTSCRSPIGRSTTSRGREAEVGEDPLQKSRRLHTRRADS
jgi:hypothetical protein